MPASKESAGSRRFVASARRIRPMWVVVVVLGSVAAMFLMAYIVHAAGAGKAAWHMSMLLFVFPYLGFVGLVTNPKRRPHRDDLPLRHTENHQVRCRRHRQSRLTPGLPQCWTLAGKACDARPVRQLAPARPAPESTG